MGLFKLAKMTVPSFFKKSETIQYPAEPEPSFEALRGTVHVDIDKCFFCGICAKKCPADAIEVNKEDETWSINHFKCVHCGECVTSCTKQCLYFEKEHVSPSAQKATVVASKRAAKPTQEAEPEQQTGANDEQAALE